MIRVCRLCKRPYWRYTLDYPPPPYCSVPCWEARKAQLQSVVTPQLPAVVLAAMRDHRLNIHGTTSTLVWYDCERCEQLEADYAASLQWHQDRASIQAHTSGGRHA